MCVIWTAGKVNVSFGPQEGKCVIWTAGKVNACHLDRRGR